MADTDEQSQANIRGIIGLMVAMAVFVGNDTFVKLASDYLPSTEIMVLRGIIASLMVFLVLFWRKEARFIAASRNRYATIRAILEGIIALLFISALAHIPLPDMTALGLTVPLVITACSALLFKEQVGWRRWAAIIVGFIGMLMVVRPGGNLVMGWPLIFAVIVPVLVAARDLLTLKVPRDVPSLVLTLTTTASVAVVGLIAAPAQTWVWPNGLALLYITSASLFLVIGNYAIIIAFRGVEVSVVAPYRYVVIIYAIILGYFVWGDRPDNIALCGIALIILAGLYTLHRQRLKRAEKAG